MAEQSTFLVKGANLPASTVGTIEVPYRGRVLKIAGDRTFEPWTVTVINDETFQLRTAFEQWQQNIQMLGENRAVYGTVDQYQVEATVRQLSRTGTNSKSYRFYGIYPVNIAAIDLAWDSNDTAEEYTVEFAVQYWEPTTNIVGKLDKGDDPDSDNFNAKNTDKNGVPVE
jgi:hypothetical protein|tara:strand:- start:797 stop:1306 length:510 start_codon:yes stop_codon:yes gene_type:complete